MSAPTQALSLPLQGHHLIEASAGTGKTWTIASLFVRLVLGLGTPQQRALHPRNILVLTFTRAATRELVDRIRLRLVQARDVFAGQVPSAEIDCFLQLLLQQVPQGPARLQATWRLEQAAAGMDDAAVLTIDAWVQRLLSEHLLEPGHQVPSQVWDSDEGWLVAVVRDYWRQQVYPLDEAAMQAVADVAPHPDALARLLIPALRSVRDTAPPINSLLDTVQALAVARAQSLQALKAPWLAWADDIEAWFATRLESNPRYFNGNRLRGGMDAVRHWCHRIRCWAVGPSAWLEGVNIGKPDDRYLRTRLTPVGLMRLHSRSTAPADERDLPAWSVAFEQLVHALDALPQAHAVVLNHALGWVAQALQRRKQQQSVCTFDDLLSQVTRSLAQQPAVAIQIAQQFPVALIDEFQDTSPAQLALFEQVYPQPHSTDHALLFIGDPKQSIYGFRGADIHSYLRVRRRLAQRLHTLDCNRRSVRPLVTALNTWLSHADQHRPDLGESFNQGSAVLRAFLHGDEVPVLPVQSEGPHERLVCEGHAMPVLCAWTQAKAVGSTDGRSRDAARAAHQIAWMLSHPRVGFQAQDGSLRRLRPQDCCVLVRSRTEAQVMAQALRDQGCASVFLSERESVLESTEALDILHLLQALLEPRSLERARRVWASETVGLPLRQLLAEHDDERLWDARIQGLQACAQQWAQQGVMAALRHFIREEGLVARAPLSPQGERRLTNLFHLAEWLESLSAQHPSPPELVRAYAHVLADPDAALKTTPGLRDATLLRLESQADVVQIVTIHKSKGLQYPVVWLPFGVSSSPNASDKNDTSLIYQDGQWHWAAPTPSAATGPADGEDSNAAEDTLNNDGHCETLREDVRLLYVALTRAVHQVWLGAVPRKPHPKQAQNWHRTALGHWVSGAGVRRTDDEVVQDLSSLWSTLQAQCVQRDPSPGPRGWVHLEVVLPEAQAIWPACMTIPDRAADLDTPPRLEPRPARAVLHPVQRHWRVASYSAIAQGAGEHLCPWRELRWDENEESSTVLAPGAPLRLQAGGPWHAWPSSADFGQLLHECLELGAESGFDTRARGSWSQSLQARLGRSVWSAYTPQVEAWLHQVVRQPLLPGGQSLCDLPLMRAELEFWMPIQALDTRALDGLLQEHLWPGEARPALKPQALEGLLMGFADLVVQCQGRLEVFDYKSNRLGDGPAGYTPAALKAAVLQHRYDLQAALYLLALHRLLRSRLGQAYCPATHLGSAHFLFLRGIDQPGGHLLSVKAQAHWLDPLDQMMGQMDTLQDQPW